MQTYPIIPGAPPIIRMAQQTGVQSTVIPHEYGRMAAQKVVDGKPSTVPVESKIQRAYHQRVHNQTGTCLCSKPKAPEHALCDSCHYHLVNGANFNHMDAADSQGYLGKLP